MWHTVIGVLVAASTMFSMHLSVVPDKVFSLQLGIIIWGDHCRFFSLLLLHCAVCNVYRFWGSYYTWKVREIFACFSRGPESQRKKCMVWKFLEWISISLCLRITVFCPTILQKYFCRLFFVAVVFGVIIPSYGEMYALGRQQIRTHLWGTCTSLGDRSNVHAYRTILCLSVVRLSVVCNVCIVAKWYVLSWYWKTVWRSK